MTLDDRLAMAALRGLVQELEGDPGAAAEVLRRVLGARPVETAIAVSPEVTPPAAPSVVDRDAKPENVTPAKPRKAPRATLASELVHELVELHGGVAAAASAVGTTQACIRRWRKGETAKPETVTKLHAALRAARESAEAAADAEAYLEQGRRLDAEPEPVRLVHALVERYDSLAEAAAATGFSLASLQGWADGAPCSEGALGRLRDAANAPRSRGDRARRSEGAARREVEDAGEEPAGEAGREGSR